MDQFSTIFNYFPQYYIIVYKEYRLGVILTYFKIYYNTKYKYLMAYTWRDIIQAAGQIKGLVESEKDIVYPNLTLNPVPYLPIQLDGLKYTAKKLDKSLCGYIRYGLENI